MPHCWFRILALIGLLATHVVAAVPGRPDRTHIVFGYMQAVGPDGPLSEYRWHALTHVGYTFVSFRSDGSLSAESLQKFRTRSPELKAGGAAKNSGVRVIAVLSNYGFKADVADAVFPVAQRRARLISEVVAMVADPATGCDGISLDIEPMNFKPATAAGFNTFVLDLSAALRRLQPMREFSMYVGSFYPGRYNIASFRACFDYILYSAYNFAPGSVVGDVGFVDGIRKGIDSWLTAGMPPEKIVLTLAVYGKQWDTSQAAWGVTGSNPKSIGMDHGNYLISTRLPPLPAHDSGAKRSCIWTAEDLGGGKFRLSTFDDVAAHERKLRLALTWDGSVKKGASLGGVGFWSLMWPAQGLHPGSVDPNDAFKSPNPALRRTFSPPWTLWEELFAPSSQKVYRAATFESLLLDPLWVGPRETPDAVNAASSCAMISAVAPPGAPPGCDRVASLRFGFTEPTGRLLYKYRPVADARAPFPIDRNASLVLTEASTEFIVPIHLSEATPGANIHLVVVDGKSELERSPAFSLNKAGWQTLRWDLADPKSVSAYSTREAAFRSGDGKIDTAGGGKRDVAFVGFEIESATNAPASGRIDIAHILYTHATKPAE